MSIYEAVPMISGLASYLYLLWYKVQYVPQKKFLHLILIGIAFLVMVVTFFVEVISTKLGYPVWGYGAAFVLGCFVIPDLARCLKCI